MRAFFNYFLRWRSRLGWFEMIEVCAIGNKATELSRILVFTEQSDRASLFCIFYETEWHSFAVLCFYETVWHSSALSFLSRVRVTELRVELSVTGHSFGQSKNRISPGQATFSKDSSWDSPGITPKLETALPLAYGNMRPSGGRAFEILSPIADQGGADCQRENKVNWC